MVVEDNCDNGCNKTHAEETCLAVSGSVAVIENFKELQEVMRVTKQKAMFQIVIHYLFEIDKEN